VCVYDVTKLETLDSLQNWMADAQLYGPQNLVFILCGNKIDRLEDESDDEDEKPDVTKSAESLKESFPYFSSHVLTSCKRDGKLETLKEEIGKQLLGQRIERPRDIIEPGRNPGKSQCC
jgi:GTPase SAR1 family protein